MMAWQFRIFQTSIGCRHVLVNFNVLLPWVFINEATGQISLEGCPQANEIEPWFFLKKCSYMQVLGMSILAGLGHFSNTDRQQN